MNQLINIEENGLNLVLEVTDKLDILLLHFGTTAWRDVESQVNGLSAAYKRGFRLMELQITGEDRDEYHGRTHRATYPGLRLHYETHRDSRNEHGRKLEIVLNDPVTSLQAVQHFQFYKDVPIVRCWVKLCNKGSEPIDVITSYSIHYTKLYDTYL